MRSLSNYRSRRSSMCILAMVATLVVFVCTSCGKIGDVFKPVVPYVPTALNTAADAVKILDEGIQGMTDESRDWRQTLVETRDKLITAGQSTLANEVNNLLMRAPSQVGAEFRCDTDFLRARLGQDLASIKERFLGHPVQAKEPAFCNVVPLSVDTKLISEGRLSVLEFYGYDFDTSTSVEVLLETADGSRVPVTQHLSKPTHYHMTLNLGSNGVQLPAGARRFVLQWNNKEISTITISQPIQPPPPTAAATKTDFTLSGSNAALYYVDLETGDFSADFRPFGAADIVLYLEMGGWLINPPPNSSAAIAKTGQQIGDKDRCASQSLSTNAIPLSDADLVPGVWFCAKTNDGRLAEFWLQKLNIPNTFSFSIRLWH